MSRLLNRLLYLMQYYEIFYGLSYYYVNIEKRLLKFYKFIKIYAYFINLIHTTIFVYKLTKSYITNFNSKKDEPMETMQFFIFLDDLGRFLKLVFFIEMRVKEERFFKKFHKFLTNFQSEYFDKISSITTDKITERIQIFNILLILIHFGYGVLRVVYHFYYGGFGGIFPIVQEGTFIYFVALENYIMFHHSLILTFIAKWFVKLNYQLKSENIHKNFIKSYLKLYWLLENVNVIYGKIIFVVLITQLVQISLDGFMLFQLFILNGASYWVCWSIIEHTMFGIHIILYFLICECINRATIETVEILMEYITKKGNVQVYVIVKIIFDIILTCF